MQSRRTSSILKTGGRRSKIALACEPCRERKSRCDGKKPICGPCGQRGYSVSRCIYKAENSRTASNDEYLRTLHERIRQLEKACTQAGVDVSTFGQDPRSDRDEQQVTQGTSGPSRAEEEDGASRMAFEAAAPSSPPSPILSLGPAHTQADHICVPSPFHAEGESNITGMGSIANSSVDECQQPIGQASDYYGNSSTASLIRLLTRQNGPKLSSSGQAVQSEPHSKCPNRPYLSNLPSNGCSSSPSRFQHVGDFLLPPRDMADHLLDCFRDRVYCLYPFFDWDAFHKAYENLWTSRSQRGRELSKLNIGLGNTSTSGTGSIVFTCALNIIFAIGCHFADIPAVEREAVAHSFFLRAKQHIGLDMLDIRSIGVVQTLLITALYLQSTPYPHRCWNSIGVACRVAQGLGLHEEKQYQFKNSLEQEIQRRTWHGCVMMDMIVSMTFGRPSMTSHLPSVPLPGVFDLMSSQDSQDPSLMVFYVATIELYQILDSILSDVYHTWRGRSSVTMTLGQGAFDVIIGLEERLIQYESKLPWFLNWTGLSPSPPSVMIDPSRRRILDRQRNVLHARFLYLRFLLYRPTFTQVCTEETQSRNLQSQGERQPAQSTLYASIKPKCATACVKTAIDLVSTVFNTYRDSTTDAWWYNGFYTATAAMVLIMSHTCRTLEGLEKPLIDSNWTKCEQILMHMAPFSLSARNTLHFLRGAYSHIVPNNPGSRTVDENNGEHNSGQHPAVNNHLIPIHHGPTAMDSPGLTGQAYNWDEVLGLASDELGFLGPIYFNELQGWLPDGDLTM